ncbi:prenyltransferase/squalene oxidase repeat-containing protein [Streptomyces qinglanensis]|uniref:Squalene-hopene cyclase C-terminal domain-containing protein n=1 Tax=Streptomyces qinglanensis TaxID=943816 RepID=A0A1H9NU57_9ACTN|nr:prenyltransferase/squalene oxidase repeat-containing protein [Streptomyces qinglanensis]SER39500.1 Squalene-hopene cyclase C-terminal domain-containing protein [Streptomyces qinglanensis]
MSPRRRRATVLAAATVLSAAAAPVASAAAPAATATSVAASPARTTASELPDGLYGTADPKYDGVWRQSMALLALDGAEAVPARKAVDWLTGQQCADGSFTAYRAEPGKKCDPDETPADVNATALAVQALAAVGGRSDAVREGLEWLDSIQNKDGGWGFGPHADSDANSTSLVIGALQAAGRNPAKTTAEGGGSPYDALLSFQLTCGSKGIEDAPGAQGAFAYQPDKKGRLAPNNDATAAAVLAALGEGALPEPPAEDAENTPVTPLKCASGADQESGKGVPGGRKAAAGAGAAHLAATLKKNGGHFTSVAPGSSDEQPDYANTADAVVALAAGGHRDAAASSLSWLADNLGKWDKARNDPAAISSLMLASRATGGDPAELGGTDLLSRLNHTGPKPAKMPEDDASEKKDSGATIPIWAFVLIGLAVGAGFGILLSGRRKRQQP